jgi:hypothetical protein
VGHPPPERVARDAVPLLRIFGGRGEGRQPGMGEPLPDIAMTTPRIAASPMFPCLM